MNSLPKKHGNIIAQEYDGLWNMTLKAHSEILIIQYRKLKKINSMNTALMVIKSGKLGGKKKKTHNNKKNNGMQEDCGN